MSLRVFGGVLAEEGDFCLDRLDELTGRVAEFPLVSEPSFVCLGWLLTACGKVRISANFDVDVFLKFVEAVLEAGERGEVGSLNIGEV